MIEQKFTVEKEFLKINPRGFNMVFSLITFLTCTSFAFAQSVTLTYGTNGEGSFIIPKCVSQITVEAWGAGGGGGYRDINSVSGTPGGGGGAYSKKIINVVSGEVYNYQIGKGGAKGNNKSGKNGGNTTFYGPGTSPILLIANGGTGAEDNNTDTKFGVGGASSTAVGVISFAGGNGGQALSDPRKSGGGGGAGSFNGAGGSAATTPIGAGKTQWVGGFSSSPGGNGGNGAEEPMPLSGTTNADGFDGSEFGGGGGGGWNVKNGIAVLGGAGGNGGVKITYIGNKTYKNVSGDWSMGENWFTGIIPNSTDCVIIPNKSVVVININNAVAKSVTVDLGGKLTVSANQSLTVTDAVINNAGAINFVVESDANLKQITETAINTGNITVKRDSPMRKNNSTYWSSPVSGQNLYGFSTGTSTTRFYYYRESDDKFYNDTFNASTIFKPGQGYAIMAPSGFTTLQTFNGSFVGVPNNGTNTTLQFPLQLSSEVPADDKGYNLIGNPYPSNIDFEKLFTINGGSDAVNGRIYNTAYFWTNVDPDRAGSTNGTGGIYSGNAYAIYNGTGGVSASGPKGAPNGGIAPTKIIKVGQGFIVKARPGQKNKNLIFDNTIRDVVGASNFFSKGIASEKDRYWLKLTSPALDVNTILIGYVPGATNEFEWDYDAPLLSVGSDSFYSALGEEKLGIQGRIYPLNPQDIVTLCTKHFDQGNYTISLGDREGIFAADQNIYLKDKQTGIITNLSEGSYTFATNIGESSTRFEIIYKPETVLATDSNVKEDLVIYRKDNDFLVKSLNKKITTLDVYDITGRLIYSSQPKSTEAVIPAEKLINNVYVLKIDRNGKISTKKILK